MASSFVSLAAAVSAVAAFFALNLGVVPHPSKAAYFAVAVDVFNTFAILSLFVILYRAERQDDGDFGAVVRRDVSTIVLALLISLIGSAHDAASRFGLVAPAEAVTPPTQDEERERR